MNSRSGTTFGIGMLAAALALAVSTAAAVAQEPAPTAEELLAKAIEASGGAAAVAKPGNRQVTGTMQLPALGISAPLTVWQARPSFLLMEIASAELGQMASGCDGDVCWENSSMQGPRIKEGAERAQALREADFDGHLGWSRHYAQAQCAGPDTVDGRAAWKLLMTPKEGAVETWWLDAASGLPVKQALTVASSMGDIPATVWFSDYREVDGLRVPHRTRQSLMNGLQVMVLSFDKVSHDVALPADRFALPPEIAALRQKAAPAGP